MESHFNHDCVLQKLFRSYFSKIDKTTVTRRNKFFYMYIYLLIQWSFCEQIIQDLQPGIGMSVVQGTNTVLFSFFFFFFLRGEIFERHPRRLQTPG